VSGGHNDCHVRPDCDYRLEDVECDPARLSAINPQEEDDASSRDLVLIGPVGDDGQSLLGIVPRDGKVLGL
jgi:hypothetical protein